MAPGQAAACPGLYPNSMNLSLAGKTAWVGGASAGIGRAAAIELAALGARVILVARTEKKLQEVLALLDTTQGQEHQYLCIDYTQREDLQRTATKLAEQTTIHILVNNTGGPPAGPIIAAQESQFLDAFQQHLLCNQLLAQTFLPGMQTAGYGRIINIISTSVKEPLDNLGVSNTIRWAVASWAKTWANEAGPHKVTVNNVLPGYTSTGRLDEIIQKRAAATGADPETVAAQFRAHVPLRRFAEPEEVAAAVAFLASPAAAYINGVNLPVDGGRTKGL